MSNGSSGWRLIALIAVLGLLLGGFGLWNVYGPQSTITIVGKSTVKAAPDQFIFTPYYQKNAKTSEEAISSVSAVGNAVVAKLSELGVTKADLTTSVDSRYVNWNNPIEGPEPVPLPVPDYKEGYIGKFTITATVRDADVAKTIVTYLATTDAVSGSITPQSDFSTDTKATLERDARAKALLDAKEKADQTVKTLGVHLAGVKSVSESSPFGMPYAVMGTADRATTSVTSVSPTFEPGTQDYPFTITVVYRIR